MMIQNYNGFVSELIKAGFSGAVGGGDDGVFALFRYGRGAEDETGIVWHTGDPDTDPWEWRLRVLEERDDIAYSKLFFKKAGYITKEWYPYFLAARRGGRRLEDEYADGKISDFAKRIYQAVERFGSLPVDEIKHHGGFSREDKSKFDAALTDLQMRMYLTISGVKRNLSKDGKEYGWTTTVFSTTERFAAAKFGDEVLSKAEKIGEDTAVNKIAERILLLNPSAREKKIIKFIKG